MGNKHQNQTNSSASNPNSAPKPDDSVLTQGADQGNDPALQKGIDNSGVGSEASAEKAGGNQNDASANTAGEAGSVSAETGVAAPASADNNGLSAKSDQSGVADNADQAGDEKKSDVTVASAPVAAAGAEKSTASVSQEGAVTEPAAEDKIHVEKLPKGYITSEQARLNQLKAKEEKKIKGK